MADDIKPDAPLNTPDAVAAALGGQSQEKAKEGGVKPETPIPFDIKSLSKEQLQTLKSMLGATPEDRKKVKESPRIRLRRIEGKIVVNFKNAFLALIDDPANLRKVEKHMIPVLYQNETEYVNVLYSTFINSEQIFCKVLGGNSNVKEVIEGETISRETGTLVDVIRKDPVYNFIVELPGGEQITIDGKVANG